MPEQRSPYETMLATGANTAPDQQRSPYEAAFSPDRIGRIRNFPAGGVLGEPVGPRGLRPLYVGGNADLQGDLPQPGQTERVVWAPETPDDVWNVPEGEYYWNPETNEVDVRGYRTPMREDTGNPWLDRFATVGNKLGDLQNSLVQGLTFNQMPRALAALTSVGSVPEAIAQGSLDPIRNTFTREHRALIADIDARRERSPVVSGVGEGVGSVGSGGALAGLVGRGAARVAPGAYSAAVGALAPRVGQAGGVARGTGRAAVGAAGGAVGGAIYGSGENRAAEGAVAGALGGAAGEPLVRGGAAIARGVGSVAGRAMGRPRPVVSDQQRPARAVLRNLRSDAEAISARNAGLGLDAPATAELMTGRGRGMVRSAASLSDEGRDLAVSYRDTTVSAAPRRASDVARMTTGRDVDFNEMETALAQNVQDVGNRQYPQFQDVQVTMTPEMINAISSPRGVRAVGDAASLAAEFGRSGDQGELRYLQRLLSGQENDQFGALGGVRAPNAGQLAQQTPDYNEALGAFVESAQGPPSAQGPTLIDFVRRSGGIRDRDELFGGGDVLNSLGQANRVPGLVNNQTGLSLADMAERARQAGYFGAARSADGNTYEVNSGISASGGELMDLIRRSLDDPQMGRYGQNEDYLAAVEDYAARQQDIAQQFGGTASNVSDARQMAQMYAEENAGRPVDYDWTQTPEAMPPQAEPPVMNASSLEDIYRVMRDDRDALLSSERDRSMGAAVSGRVSRFDDELQARVPEIANARRAYQVAAGERDALTAGRAAFRGNSPMPTLESNFGQLPSGLARQNYRFGAQSALEDVAMSNPSSLFARLNENSLRGGNALTQRLNAIGAPGDVMQRAGGAEAQRLGVADFINPNSGSQTTPLAQDALLLGQGSNLPVSFGGLTASLTNLAFRVSQRMSDAEMTELVRLGVSPADLTRLRELAQYAPDQVPSAIRSIVGAAAAVQLSNTDRSN